MVAPFIWILLSNYLKSTYEYRSRSEELAGVVVFVLLLFAVMVNSIRTSVMTRVYGPSFKSKEYLIQLDLVKTEIAKGVSVTGNSLLSTADSIVFDDLYPR